MTDRPIIFSGSMVRALLDGRKTQTRRLLNPQPEPWRDFHLEGGCQQADWRFELGTCTNDGRSYRFGLWMHSPFHESRFQPLRWSPGDRLYVRENFYTEGGAFGENFGYAADLPPEHGAPKLTPCIHMPRHLSRITLTVTDLRVQRLDRITEEDAIAEGAAPLLVPPDGGSCPHVEGFVALWESLHGDGSWAINPWVVALTFIIEHRNIDAAISAAA